MPRYFTVLMSPCCHQSMEETDVTCPMCAEPCEPVEEPVEGDERDEPEWRQDR